MTNALAGRPLRARLQRAFGFNSIAAAFSQGASFASGVAIATLVGKEAFGQYGMAFSTLVTIAGIAQLSTGLTATRYVAEHRDRDPARAGRILGMCALLTWFAALVAAALLALLNTQIATHVLSAPALDVLLLLGAGYLLFAIPVTFQLGALAGLEAFPALARVAVLHGVAHLLVVVLGCWWYGLEGAIGALGLSVALRWLLMQIALLAQTRRRGIRLDYRPGPDELRLLMRFSLPAALAGLTTLPSIWLANVLLVRQDGGYGQFAVFTAANALRNLALFVPGLVNEVGTSLINNEKGSGDALRFRRMFAINVAATVMTAAAGAVVLFAGAPWLMRLYGPEFVDGSNVLMVLTVALILQAAMMGSYQIIQSQERMWYSFVWVALPRDIMLVVAAFLLVPTLGALGLALGHVASAACALAFTLAAVARTGITATDPRTAGAHSR